MAMKSKTQKVNKKPNTVSNSPDKSNPGNKINPEPDHDDDFIEHEKQVSKLLKRIAKANIQNQATTLSGDKKDVDKAVK